MSLRMTKIQKTANTNCQEGVEQQELCFTAGGNVDSTANLEDSLVVSYKTEPGVTRLSNNCTPRYLPSDFKTDIHTKTFM